MTAGSERRLGAVTTRRDKAMPKFTVHFQMPVSIDITVEADNPEQAIDLAYDSDDMPGSMAHDAFGDAPVDEDGDWRPVAVSDEKGFLQGIRREDYS
jgi:hypothetical protein